MASLRQCRTLTENNCKLTTARVRSVKLFVVITSSGKYFWENNTVHTKTGNPEPKMSSRTYHAKSVCLQNEYQW